MPAADRPAFLLETEEEDLELPFLAWRANVHSQCGEDGIIRMLLDQGGVETRYFVEFGAWDGRHLSNCAALADAGWAGCFIEGDGARFEDLKKTYAHRPDIACLHAFVRTSGEDRLDALLGRVGAPEQLGVLSIDIDGCDYHVWNSVQDHKPALCVIEFNPTIPAHVVYAQEEDAKIHRGASLAALTKLSATKGYSLVAATEWNAFFMPSTLCEARGIRVYRPREVKLQRYEAALFHGYDGTMLVGGHRSLLWHGVEYEADSLQVLPPDLRHFVPAAPEGFEASLQDYRRKR